MGIPKRDMETILAEVKKIIPKKIAGGDKKIRADVDKLAKDFLELKIMFSNFKSKMPGILCGAKKEEKGD